MRRNLLSDVIRQLGKLNILKSDCSDPDSLVAVGSPSFTVLREAQLFDTIDFIRAVHAEAAALFAAPGRTRNTTLYVTTFPCHECARHIVFCGIKRVVYVEPYPKSLVVEMFRDSIAVDQDRTSEGKVQFMPFTGVSPRVYQYLFLLTKDARKEKDGKLKRWVASQAVAQLHISYSERATETAETEKLDRFQVQLVEKGIKDDSISGAAGEGLVADGP